MILPGTRFEGRRDSILTDGADGLGMDSVQTGGNLPHHWRNQANLPEDAIVAQTVRLISAELQRLEKEHRPHPEFGHS